MSEARYFVFSRDAEWIVALDGLPVGRHGSQADALQSAIVMADLMGSMRHDADVMMEEAGRLEVVWTYGIDSLPALTEKAA
jgi:hypothetical protein